MGFFSPKDNSFLKHYKELANYVIDSSKLLVKMVELPSDKYASISRQMHDLETAADSVKLDCKKWINDTFVTPYDRDDMYALSSCLDDIIDAYDKTIDVIYLFEIHDLPKRVTKQVAILEDLAISTYAVISALADVRATFSEVEKIHTLVTSSEKAHRELLAKLFKDRKSVDIIKSKELIESLNEITASYKAVASVIETMGIKES